MPTFTLTPARQRRFILGRQGLWPGRRWRGREGTAQALRQTEAVQIDPVTVVAQSHDIALWGRVLDYAPPHLLALAYEDRAFFDYGGILYFYPMEELPYWRVFMERRSKEGRWHDFLREHPALIAAMRALLRERGPLRNRDLGGNKVGAYRSSKDSGVALYAMWMTGELMTYGRHGKERIYDFAENIVPTHLRHTAVEEEALRYFLIKGLAQRGLSSARDFRALLKEVRDQPVDLKEANAVLAERVAAGDVRRLHVQGQKEPYYYLTADEPLIAALNEDRIPAAWAAAGPTTAEEVTFLSPLDYVSARGRARKLFDFDYIWEIYKPAEKRVYGPYTLPILYGDRLVGRMDVRHDRPSATLVINDLWLEEWFAADAPFLDALTAGLARFTHFLEAEQIDPAAITSRPLRQHLTAHPLSRER